MTRQGILLRGINLGAVNKVPMPALRAALDTAGLGGGCGARSYLQSGNVAVSSELEPGDLGSLVQALVLEQFGVSSPVVVRSLAQMRAVVDGDPFPQRAQDNPKTYQVSFLSEPITDAGRELLGARADSGDEVAVSASGMEVYASHPGGIRLSKLAAQLTERKLGVPTVTARNWTTVLGVLDLLES